MVGPLFLSSPLFLRTIDLRPQAVSIKNDSEGKEKQTTSGKKVKKNPQEDLKRELEIQKLAQIDQRVRAHELAHMAVGGQYAGAPSYSYVVGPDGKLYAVAGEVPIDLSEEPTPEATVNKMRQVIAAALAPADPSPQDYRVAAIASQKLMKALQKLAQKRLKEIYENNQGGEGNKERNLPENQNSKGVDLKDKWTEEIEDGGLEKKRKGINPTLKQIFDSYCRHCEGGLNCRFCNFRGLKGR